MALSEKEVLEVLELFQKSGWESLQLQSGELRLSISKTGAVAGFAPEAEPARPAQVPAPVAKESGRAPVAPAKIAIDARWVAVKAPMLGTFYAAPKPGAPPFVKTGQQIHADDNVAIVEVMKLMNYVKAGVGGRVAHIAAINGELVEFDQPLLYIDPENAS
jgi:acetyl-CoA carboxylase biotin carboxyl carrier protein